MFACIHAPAVADVQALVELGGQFAPSVEVSAPTTVVFSIDGLERLMGSPRQIASEIARLGAIRHIQASLAIASNPDAAVLAARYFPGLTLIPKGREAAILGELPLSELSLPDDMRDTLRGWGVRTFAEFAALPPLGIVERFGAEGLRLQDRARGAVRRPLLLERDPAQFERSIEFDYPVEDSQSLLFVVNGMLSELCREMRLHGVAASELRLTLNNSSMERAQNGTHSRVLAFATPMREPAAMLKLLQLNFDAHPPGEAVFLLTVTLVPVKPRLSQNGLFLPQTPEPTRLQILLARIGGIIGEENVGSPELLDTHRPDAFVLKPYAVVSKEPLHAPLRTSGDSIKMALRIYRPALIARVLVDHGRPRRLTASGISGNVTNCSGPWRGSGEWWTRLAWSRDEWDISLTDGGVYRIYCYRNEWFVAGVYD